MTALPARAAVRPSRRSARCAAPAGGGGIAGKSGRRKPLGRHRLQGVGSGKMPVIASNRGVSMSMNSRAIRSPMAVRRRRDHSLARVDRHVAEAGLGRRRGPSSWATTEMAGSRSTASSTSSWNEGGRGTARQSYGRPSSSSRTRIAKSPEPWMIGRTLILRTDRQKIVGCPSRHIHRSLTRIVCHGAQSILVLPAVYRQASRRTMRLPDGARHSFRKRRPPSGLHSFTEHNLIQQLSPKHEVRGAHEGLPGKRAGSAWIVAYCLSRRPSKRAWFRQGRKAARSGGGCGLLSRSDRNEKRGRKPEEPG